MICQMCFETEAQEDKTVCKECETAIQDGSDENIDDLLSKMD